MKKFYFLILAALVMAACETSPSGGGGGGGGGSHHSTVDGIPDDSTAVPNPDITGADTIINLPGVQTTVTTDGGDIVIRLDMTGIINPETGDFLKLIGSGSAQNVFVEVDDVPKGIEVINLSESSGATVMADLVFLVDNSGSMDDEADTIANGIDAWSKLLANSGLDIRFGVVGYDGEITGALDIATSAELSAFLNKEYTYGTSRTHYFAGPNAAELQSLAPSYYNGGDMDECGMAALHFANNHFKFRNGANRIYVNFTDEPNYHMERDTLRTSWLINNWESQLGTVHSVFSAKEGTEAEVKEYVDYNAWGSSTIWDYPWDMATLTGGSKLFADGYFNGVNLASLPVTGAMQNSYIIRFTNVAELMDGQEHEIHITILTLDGSVAGEVTIKVVFGTAA